ncbi:hypothetical protein WM03_21050 [Burkholderia ubonensis]|uniref:hypothetical protein n=1 Tax=Burkholderia ubonensis TaxID=101571 RepID=UPI00075549DC|nr:hypothetical protein [Burkholderia ubonensis]KVN70894.1 hypothetical protein WJ65_06475 [Burkholderia ubonensis]KWI17395.1 hypothetical protein WM02_07825 [Burkholderia ubonensis]KWI24445.1 hypothetical protein WM03_21050 [Burkholderia ubonensis]ODQ36410.1 hypothetical protein BGV63_17685 [Burkholderia ubonensis]OJA29526.1 hypothetical protein BGV58_12715 [Burkholderia ubonensis]
MRADDMLVSVRSRKLACVLDPALVLGSRVGLAFALRLSRVLEPWLTRSFWQVIDASELLLPGLAAGAPNDDIDAPWPLADVLQAWIALRDATDASAWPLRWIGDNLAESQLDGAAAPGIVMHYEALAEALAARLRLDEDPVSGIWPSRWRPREASVDALALSAALDGALVLTASVAQREPWPVQALARLGRPARLLDSLPAERSASLFAAERALLLDALAAAGLASLAQELPPLVALHVNVVPAMVAAAAPHVPPRAEEGLAPSHRIDAANPWDDVRAWWYYL